MVDKQHSIDISSCLADPQIQLSNALATRNVRDFRIALDMGAEAALADQHHGNIYEKALATYGCAEFVEECLKRGCSPHHVNKHFDKAAISYASDSRDPHILMSLLKYEGVQVDRKYAELTPLNSLAKGLNADNVNDVIACLKLLLNYGASPNIPDQREMTALHYVVKNRKIDDNKKREIVQLFFERHDLDIDTYRDGELRQLLQHEFSDLQLPEIRSNKLVDMEVLLCYIRAGDMEKFLQHFPEYQLNISDKDNLRNTAQEQYLPLLIECIQKGAHAAFDVLLGKNLNVNAVWENSNALEVAAIWGNWYALQKLLDHPDLKLRRDDHPLITVICKMSEDPLQAFCDYRKCFYVLIESEKVNINEKDDSGSTPLHYAVKYRNNEAIRELLRRGSYIGAKSCFNDLSIDGVSPELLEEHFDNCITSNNRKLGDKNFEIIINYMNLLPRLEVSSSKMPVKQLRDEMAPIAFIAKSKEHRHLLQHPLITSYLFLKWHRLSVVFFVNFLMYVFFAVSIITHTILKFRESEYEAVTALFGLFSWIGIIYMILRECTQMIMSPLCYFRSLANYMELALIGLSIVTCSEPTYDKETQRVIAVFTMLLIAIELCLLVGSLPVLSISTHMLMLDAVCRSFLKSFALYSIFVITFSLCFYILFGKPEMNPKEPTASNEDNGEFNKFTNPLTALIKTIVMLTGEFDAGDLEFDSLYNYLLFLLFVFFMTIVLLNLLNGLAVSDTQAIKGQAELNGSICRTNLLTRYEKVLTGRADGASFIVNHEPFRSICRRLTNLYPNYLAGRQIAILPNDNNKVLIPTSSIFELKEVDNSLACFLPLSDNDHDKQKKLLDPPVRFLPCCCSCITGSCSKMDVRTVKMALTVIEKKASAIRTQLHLKTTEKRLQNIEQKLEKIFEILQDSKTK
uniref:Ion transport domain-containing protein n=1 Tax=Glossina palpalis gambiensis TaxID=67801 RepID=A0A1B0BSL0_9MUSC